jgi:hypothetical protein
VGPFEPLPDGVTATHVQDHLIQVNRLGRHVLIAPEPVRSGTNASTTKTPPSER